MFKNTGGFHLPEVQEDQARGVHGIGLDRNSDSDVADGPAFKSPDVASSTLPASAARAAKLPIRQPLGLEFKMQDVASVNAADKTDSMTA